MYKDFYHLPARAQTGVTSSKIVDYQAGFETMQSLLLTAMMGVNVTSQSAGSLENLLTVSFEKTVIDDEIISRVRKIKDGLNVNDETLSVDIIMDVGHGCDYLIHDSTLDYMMDGWQPAISDWNSYEKWAESPQQDIEMRAAMKVREIIAEAPVLLGESLQKDLKNYIASCS